jgi:hypothetical protein
MKSQKQLGSTSYATFIGKTTNRIMRRRVRPAAFGRVVLCGDFNKSRPLLDYNPIYWASL